MRVVLFNGLNNCSLSCNEEDRSFPSGPSVGSLRVALARLSHQPCRSTPLCGAFAPPPRAVRESLSVSKAFLLTWRQDFHSSCIVLVALVNCSMSVSPADIGTMNRAGKSFCLLCLQRNAFGLSSRFLCWLEVADAPLLTTSAYAKLKEVLVIQLEFVLLGRGASIDHETGMFA